MSPTRPCPRRRGERGMTTAEYAVCTVGAAGCALILLTVGPSWFLDMFGTLLAQIDVLTVWVPHGAWSPWP